MKFSWSVASAIGGLVFGAISMVAGVVSAVDQVKNGDRRAAITGQYAGQQYYNAKHPPKAKKKDDNEDFDEY